jgi:hypothetical protein
MPPSRISAISNIDIFASSPIASPGHESIYRVKAGTVIPLVMSVGSDKLIEYNRKRVVLSC